MSANATNTTAPTLTADISIAYAAIITMALIPIYIGSHWSLFTKHNKDTSNGREEDKFLTPKDAYMFPLVASGFLFSLYMVFKIFSKEYVNLLLTTYISVISIYSVLETFRPILKSFFPKLDGERKNVGFDMPFKIPYFDVTTRFDVTNLDYLNFFISISILAWYLTQKHWIANNVLGFCFAIQGVAKIQISSYKVCCILLTGLFFYDIFWVFGTDVMVTVAKSFDAPIKLLFPKSLFASDPKFSMLGLGDIVLPGVFIAFLLRYDSFRAFKDDKPTSIFPKTYFSISFASYLLGLITTIFVMHTFQAAQPALLYLTPACIISSLLTALKNRDIEGLFAYSEEVEEEKKKPALMKYTKMIYLQNQMIKIVCTVQKLEY